MSPHALSAKVYLDTNRTIGQISPLLFGGFVEHMGRCVYEGIYEPASPHADAQGLRTDVLAALRDLGLTTIRYPGGNFLSGYRWLDGVGPREQRPRRRDLAWQSIETNQFGTNEFMGFCKAIGAEPMLGVNLGTGTIEEAAALVEYANGPTGSAYADLRAAHGFAQPHGVRYWCLGNEMDGPWQIGHLDAVDYGKKAREAAKMMRWHDSSIKLVLCGSSSTGMPTYPEWDRLALESCWEHVDYLSLHYYANNHAEDTPSYLALSYQFERHLDTLAGTLRFVKEKLRSKHDVFLSWDEWNVWYKARHVQGGWTEAPHLIEEVYNLEDALVVAQWLNVFLRRCDVLQMACIAQIVNVIAPILTTTEGLLRQSIFYPLQLISRNATGASLAPLVQAPTHETAQFGQVPALDVSASYDEAAGRGAVFLVNRSLTETVETEIVWQTGVPTSIVAAHQLAGSDPKAANSFAEPDLLVAQPVAAPAVVGGRTTIALPPLSFTALVVAF